MLRTSTAADIPALQALWQHCFGDPPAYTRLYFAHLWQPEQVFLAAEGPEVQAMVIWFPLQVSGRPAAYFYAVCTDPAYRSRGISRRLLAYAEASLRTRGVGQFLLVPGDAGLFRFYAAQGYTCCGTIGQAQLGQPAPGDVAPLKPEDYLVRRARCLTLPHAAYSLPLLEHQARLCALSGGGLFALGETGCAVCERTPEGTLLVKELLGCDPVSGGNALLYHFHLARGAVRFPDPHGTPFCMGKALAQSPLYLGLAFD